MLGQTIVARSPFPRSSVVWLMIAAVFLAWAIVSNNLHPAIFAVLPLSLSVAAWFARPRGVVFTIDHDGLLPLGSGERVAYDTVRAMVIGGRVYTGGVDDVTDLPIELALQDRVFIVPARVNVPKLDLIRFLHEQIPARDERAVPEILAGFFADQCEKFGTAKVEVIHARQHFTQSCHKRRNRAYVLAVLVTGIAWIVLVIAIGASAANGRSLEEFGGWIGFGCLMAMFSGLLAIALRRNVLAGNRQTNLYHQDACIVISPAGFAMSQGDLQGILRWNQVTSATSRMSQWLRSRRVSGLQLTVQGGEIIALDIYERTPYELELLVRKNLDHLGS